MFMQRLDRVVGILFLLALFACSDTEPKSAPAVGGDPISTTPSIAPEQAVPNSNRGLAIEAGGAETGIATEAGMKAGTGISTESGAALVAPRGTTTSSTRPLQEGTEAGMTVDPAVRGEVVAVLTQALGKSEPPYSSEVDVGVEVIHSSDPEDLMDAIAVLEESGGPDAIDAIGLILEQSRDPEVRIEALDALAILGEESDISRHLANALDDPSPDVRIEVADVAAELSLVGMLPDLRGQFERERDPDVRDALDEAIVDLEFDQEEGSYR
jgi:hypothetical protein